MKKYAISLIITECDGTYGARMGRCNEGERPTNPKVKIFDRPVPLSIDGCYDRGGAYWGYSPNGATLRVAYTKDLSYIEFYRSLGGYENKEN